VLDVEENVCKRRHCEKVRKFIIICLILKFVVSQRLRWAGHVSGREEAEEDCQKVAGCII
jgi:hypothetical protein